jgi:hypothetical protein
MENQYRNLLVEDYCDAADLVDYKVSHITNDSREIIEVLYAEYEPGKYAAGYRVYWANKRISFRLPNPSNGYFRSERDAKLYILGFMMVYSAWFLPETVTDIKDNITKLSINTLF